MPRPRTGVVYPAPPTGAAGIAASIMRYPGLWAIMGFLTIVICLISLQFGLLGFLGMLVIGRLLPVGGRGSGRVSKFAPIGSRFRSACAALDIGQVPPRVRKVTEVPSGRVLEARLLRGTTAADLEADAERLASLLHVREVRIERVPADASRVRVHIVERDSLEAHDAVTSPTAASPASTLSMWDPVTLGVDEFGQRVTVNFFERNLLVGGEPGGGKSVAISLICSVAARDPDARLWLFDGKLVELSFWRNAPNVETFVGTDVYEANAQLSRLQELVDDRLVQMTGRGIRKIDPSIPLHFVVVDEIAHYSTHEDQAAANLFSSKLRDLVARGRAPGVIVIAATQKPGSDIIPTSLRDLFSMRLAFRCNTWQASDSILGGGWYSLGFDASHIPLDQRGTGYLLAEEGRPVRMRTYYLSDDDMRSIAPPPDPTLAQP